MPRTPTLALALPGDSGKWSATQIEAAAAQLGLHPPEGPRISGAWRQWKRIAVSAIQRRREAQAARRRSADRRRHQSARKAAAVRKAAVQTERAQAAYVAAQRMELHRTAKAERSAIRRTYHFQRKAERDRTRAWAKVKAAGIFRAADALRGRAEEQAEEWRRRHLAETYPAFRCHVCGSMETPARWGTPALARALADSGRCWTCREWEGYARAVEAGALGVVRDGILWISGTPVGAVPPWWGAPPDER